MKFCRVKEVSLKSTYRMQQQTLCTPGRFSVIHQQVLELKLQLLVLEFERILAQSSWPNS